MRTDSARFHHANTQLSKEPRHVVNIEFPTASIYCTSHGDISGVPGVVMNSVLRKPVVVSQRIVPDEGRSEIGAASFELVDLASVFTNDIRSKLAAGNGLRRRRVRFYRGFAGFAWADMQLIQTQIVRDASFDAGVYQVECNDVTRDQRKDVFTLAETTLTANVSPTDTTINVNNTAAFALVVHDASYTDAPSSTVGYFRIKDERIRYTGKTSTTFTGCTRAVFGTRAAAYTVDAATAQDRREKVTEYVYLEGPVPKILYAIQTGILHGDSANLPSTWHCGIDSTLIRLTDYTAIGPDLWVPGTPTAGLRCRFEGLTKTDGKSFIERELLTLIGCFQPVYADGALGLKRATRIFRDAAPIFELNERNSVQIGALVHDMESLHNDFRIHWNWNGERYTRSNILIDQTSINAHGRAPLRELSFKGLHGSIHTDGFILKLVDGQRDRFAGPPERMSVQLLHGFNRAEVGDVVRGRYPSVRDYAGPAGAMDRAFEIQQLSDDGERFRLELFGSTAASSVQSPTGAASALPDASYTSQGTNLTSVLTIVGDVVQAGTYNLTGNADLNNAGAIYYYAGNLTIADGAVINFTGNIQLRIRGFLQINGDINGQGGGLAGVVDGGGSLLVSIESGTGPGIFNTIAGNPGFVGGSRGMDGAQVRLFVRQGLVHTVPCAAVIGKNPTAPPLPLSVVSGALAGLPTDLRGSGGAPGGRGVEIDHDQNLTNALGGSGAAGGAGLCIVCRGMAFGASGSIDLDGNDAAPTSQVDISDFPGVTIAGFPGAGGAGGPGTLYVLLDGSGLSVPSIGTNNFSAQTGTVPINGNPLPRRTFNDAIGIVVDVFQPVAGYLDEALISGLNLFNAAQRIQYVPAAETANPDVNQKPPAPTALTATGFVGLVAGSISTPINLKLGVRRRVYASITNNRPDSVLVSDADASTFSHSASSGVLRYYWSTTFDPDTNLESDFFPNTMTSTITATALSGGSFTLIPRGNMVVNGNKLQKVGGSSAWDSDAYSVEIAVGGAFVSARASQTNADIIFGLNSDPTTDQNYTSLDYSWQFTGAAGLAIYESGVLQGTFGSYTTSTVLSIQYDGTRVNYYKDNVLQRSVAAPANLALSFDCSFWTPGGELNSIAFGPMGSRGAVGPVVNANNLIANGTFTVIDGATGRFANFVDNPYAAPQAGEGFVGPYSYRAPTTTAGNLVTSDSYIAVDLLRYRYEFRTRYKGVAGTLGYFGLAPIDEKLRAINPENSFGLFNRGSTLNANANVNDTTVDIVAVSGFTTSNILKNGGANDFIQLGANVGGTSVDLPNFETYGVASVADLGGGVWRVTLDGGVTVAVARTAGTGIRFSESGGGYAYTPGSPLSATTSYVQEKGFYSGFNGITTVPDARGLRNGTKYVKPIWLPNFPGGSSGPSDADEWELYQIANETSPYVHDPYFRTGCTASYNVPPTDWSGMWSHGELAAFSAGSHVWFPAGGWPGGGFQLNLATSGVNGFELFQSPTRILQMKPTPLQNGVRVHVRVRFLVISATNAGAILRILNRGLRDNGNVANLNTNTANYQIDIPLGEATTSQLIEREFFVDVQNLGVGHVVYYDPMFQISGASSGTIQILGIWAGPEQQDQNPDLVVDPEFSLATDETYWMRGASGGSVPTIALTGGIVGGLLSITGQTTAQFVTSRRQRPWQAALGEYYSVRLRWRRTNSLTGTGNAFSAGVTRWAPGVDPESVGVTALGGVNMTVAEMNARTEDVWQEDQGVVRLSRTASYAGGDLPFLSAQISVSTVLTGGVIEVDYFDVVPGTAANPMTRVRTSGATLDDTDMFKNNVYDSSSAGTFTLASATAARIGSKQYFEQIGTGLLTIAPGGGGGDTLTSPPNTTGSRALSGRYAKAFVEYRDVGVVNLQGSLA